VTRARGPRNFLCEQFDFAHVRLRQERNRTQTGARQFVGERFPIALRIRQRPAARRFRMRRDERSPFNSDDDSRQEGQCVAHPALGLLQVFDPPRVSALVQARGT